MRDRRREAPSPPATPTNNKQTPAAGPPSPTRPWRQRAPAAAGRADWRDCRAAPHFVHPPLRAAAPAACAAGLAQLALLHCAAAAAAAAAAARTPLSETIERWSTSHVCPDLHASRMVHAW